VAGIVVLAVAAVAARSVALAGFGLDSLIEIGASTVVLWELSGAGEQRQRRALRLIGGAFCLLAAYLLVQSLIALSAGYRPGHSALGIAWTAATAAAMFGLAAAKAGTGRALGNPVLITEGRVTLVDGILAVAVLTGIALNAAAGIWWADPLAALVIVFYALREAREILLPDGERACHALLGMPRNGAQVLVAAGCGSDEGQRSRVHPGGGGVTEEPQGRAGEGWPRGHHRHP
jgi:divalent metal cation (Fe/Co/Zn/Cd) transporter